MSRHLVRLVTLLAAFGAVAAPRRALAKDLPIKGALGADSSGRFRLSIGGLTSNVVVDQNDYRNYNTSATALVGRFDLGAFVVPTRLGTPVGMEAGLGFGWMGKGGNLPRHVDGKPDPESPAWGGIYLAVDAGMVAGLVDRSWLRVQARAGASLDVDATALYGGGRLWVGAHGFSLELTGDVRYGRSFSDDQMREWRLDGLIEFTSWGFGLSHLQGFSEDDGNATSTRRLFKGSYQLTMLQVMWRVL